MWEFGIPVQIKYIADPSLHSLPAVTMHPNGQSFVGQSMDNQIVTYSAKDKFRQNRKKTFKVGPLQPPPPPLPRARTLPLINRLVYKLLSFVSG